MAAYRFQALSGEIPRLDRRLLPEGAAQIAENVVLTSGRLDPMYRPLAVATAPLNAKSIFRMYDLTGDFWLSWVEDVDVVRAPIAGDETFRIYFTSDSFGPRATNLAMATSAPPYPAAWFVLGVTPPIVAATVTPVGGAAATVTRAYLYTFVTPWGEESAPSPASIAQTAPSDASWDLSAMQVAPPNSGTVIAAVYALGQVTVTLNSVFGLRAKEMITIAAVTGMTDLNGIFRIVSVDAALSKVVVTLTTAQTYTGGGTWARKAPHNTSGMTKRIYRSITAAGATDYFFVGEIAVATTTFSDTASITIGEPIPSIGWLMPPADLQNMRVLPSGALCGFTSNTLCMSEPYVPYAWPLAFRLTSDYPIVGIGVFGQSVVVGTTGQPYVAQGVDPASTSLVKLEQNWPCLSKRGIAEFGGAVYYPSSLGLVSVSAMGAAIVTEQFFAQYAWLGLDPGSFIAANYDGDYYTRVASGSEDYVLVISRARNVSKLGIQPSELYTDPGNGKIYAAQQTSIVELNADRSDRMPMNWKSKEMILPKPVSFGCGKIDFDVTFGLEEVTARDAVNTVTLASNTAVFASGILLGGLNDTPPNQYEVNGSALQSLLPSLFSQLKFTLYGDNKAIYDINLADQQVFRLPAGYSYDNYAIGLAGNAAILSVAIAETLDGLKTV